MQATNYLTLYSANLASVKAATMNLSTLTGSTITASILTLSTLTVSTINGALPGTGSGGTGPISSLTVSSLVSVSNISTASTMYTSSLITTGNVGVGTVAPGYGLQVAKSIYANNFQQFEWIHTQPGNIYGNNPASSPFVVKIASLGPTWATTSLGMINIRGQLGGWKHDTTMSIDLNIMTRSTFTVWGTVYGIDASGIADLVYVVNGSGNYDIYIYVKSSTWILYDLTVSGNTGVNVLYDPSVTTATSVIPSGSVSISALAYVYQNGGNIGIGTRSPAGRLTSYSTSADHSIPPDGNPTNHQLVITNSKTGTTPYAMAIGMDQTYGCGYINAAGNSSYQPVCLQTRGGSVGIGITNPGASYALHVQGAIYASGNITALSDQRFKQNIVRLDRSLEKISQLSGYSYTRPDYQPDVRQIGLLAQEVKEVLPEAVSYDSVNDTYSLNYGCLMAPVIEAVKEINEKVDSRISELEAKISAQQVLIQQLLDRSSPVPV